MSGVLFIAEGIEITSLEQVIECLQHHHDRIEHWKSTQPTHQDLTIATININAIINFLKNTHHQEHLSLKAKVKVLEDALSKMETELTDLKKELSRNKQLFMLHDLNRIFRYYIDESKIGSWGTFV
jgi:predicted nucleic acid-binding protein